MSGTVTKRLINVYEQMAAPTLFLSGFFTSPPENFHTTEEVEIDIVRCEEDVSIAIQDLSAGYRTNADDLYTNKGFKPPIHKESIPLNAFDLLKRVPGQNAFASPDFRANVISRLFKGMVKVESKIRRAIELQASQVLQTGIATLTDQTGASIYSIDYKPKATHFPTSGTTWGLVGATVINDISALCEVVRGDGLSDPDQLIMGIDAFEAFIQDEGVQKRFDNRRIDLGTISPREIRGGGGSYRGVVEIGNYRLDVWTYNGRFKHPQTGASTPYLDAGKVIVRASTARMDATFGAIPNIGTALGLQGAALLPEMPGRLSSSDRSIDLFTNAWITPDGEQLFGGVGARPLMIPTAIDTYGCLDTGL